MSSVYFTLKKRGLVPRYRALFGLLAKTSIWWAFLDTVTNICALFSAFIWNKFFSVYLFK